MGRHTKREQSEDEPVPDDPAPTGPFYGAPPGPSFEAFSGPTDDQVFFSYEPFPAGTPAGPPPAAQRQHGPPEQLRFEPYPGDYPGGLPASVTGHDDRAYGDGPFPGPADDRAPIPAAAPAPGHPDDPAPAASAPAAPGDDPAQPRSARTRVARLVSALPVPMLPIVALVIAVGVVAYALSTQQISLNFAGGAPKDPVNPRDSTVSQRGPGNRASRASRPDGLVIAFHVTSRTSTAFRATGTITNQGRNPVERWAVAFRIPDVTFRAVSGATLVKTGKLLYVRGRAGIAPGRSVQFVFTATGKPRKPTYCIMNSLACTIL
ncbi:cellulose binding domain-containing protein [Actinomadura opuntiae]|uniref:cellulose binding domain-containing protein n=1 Tax=Actinomadura sp. OS1-43 TaxID=604315 RepID=UPI00255B179A|nr:cellulose binding domain-containing protein [Actinomadura sp. OS1-43]MDL4818819.1 cellulose binding domain-containing protein [Actinomadura sp. OS1-43]